MTYFRYCIFKQTIKPWNNEWQDGSKVQPGIKQGSLDSLSKYIKLNPQFFNLKPKELKVPNSEKKKYKQSKSSWKIVYTCKIVYTYLM